MRRFVPLVAFWIASCSGAVPPTTPATVASVAKKPHFDNVPPLKWPGEPTVSVDTIPLPQGEQKSYSATYTDRSPDGLLLYSLAILEYSADAMKTMTPKELLDAYVFGSKPSETERREITNGAKKHPGLAIRAQTGDRYTRHEVVCAGTRLYSVTVNGKTEAALASPAVEAFFASFVLE